MVQSKLGGATRIVGSSCARIGRLKIAALPAATPNTSAFLRVIKYRQGHFLHPAVAVIFAVLVRFSGSRPRETRRREPATMI
jgi:hypothetical protein